MKKILIALAVILLIIVGVVFYRSNLIIEDKNISIGNTNYVDATYTINGVRVTLKNGYSETEAVPGSASKIITKRFGNEVKHDFNGDGREDIAFLLTQETGGSGVFFYVVAALNTPNGYIGSDGFLLGDRIAPQTTEISGQPGQKDVVIVNYADRKTGEPMTTQPSIGKSVYLKLDTENMQWGIVAPNFEGEADTSKMTLSMQTWTWISTLYNDGMEIKPSNSKKFTLTFNTDNTFSATTDCNLMGGEYALSENKISFDKVRSTLKYCEGSQEGDFSKIFSEAESYHFTSKGELIFDLKLDSGSAIFR